MTMMMRSVFCKYSYNSNVLQMQPKPGCPATATKMPWGKGQIRGGHGLLPLLFPLVKFIPCKGDLLCAMLCVCVFPPTPMNAGNRAKS